MSKAWKLGYQACYAGKDWWGNNPFAPGSKEHSDWGIGYEEATLDKRNGR